MLMASIDGYNGEPASADGVEGKPGKLNRREFIAGASNVLTVTAAAGVLGASYLKSKERRQGWDGEVSQDQESATTESIELYSAMQEMFERQLEGKRIFYESMRFDEMVFINEDTQEYVAGPVKLEDVIIDTPNGPKRISVGKRNKDGILEGGIAGAWLTHWREELGIKDIKTRALNITKAFEKFINKEGEPELRELILRAVRGEEGGIATLKDLIRYFGNNPARPVEGDPQDRPFMQYLYEEVEFDDANKEFKMPELAKELLREYLIGIASHESRFVPATSSSGAGGILQFMPNTQDAYLPTNLTGFRAEVAGVGSYLVDNYGHLDYWMKNMEVEENGAKKIVPMNETYETLRGMFSTEEDWLRYFYLPCLITAYNAGAKTLGQALHWFNISFDKEYLESIASGGDNFGLFYYFTRFARQDNYHEYVNNFGYNAQGYFASVEACTNMLKTNS